VRNAVDERGGAATASNSRRVLLTASVCDAVVLSPPQATRRDTMGSSAW
jgi:hypothetical protein